MPILDPELRLKLRRLGIDPDTEAEEVPSEQPVVNPTPQPLQKQTSSFGAGAREFLRNSPATVAGLAAFPKAAMLGAPAGPVGSAITGISGSLLAGLATRWAQDKLIENVAPTAVAQAYQQSQEQDAMEHPIASAVGGVSSGLLGMKPDARAMVGGARAIRDLITKPIMANRIDPRDAANLANVGLGAAIPTGVEYGQQVAAQGTLLPELDLRTMAINAVGGALLNNPNKSVGQKLGLKPNTYREYITDGMKARHANSEPAQASPEEVAAEKQYQAEYEAQPYIQELRAREAEIAARKQYLEEFKQLKREKYEVNKQFEAELEADRAERIAQANKAALEEKQASENQNAQRRAEDFIPAKVEELQQEPLVVRPRTENRPQPRVITEQQQEIYPDYTGNQAIDEVVNQQAPKTEAEIFQEEYDRGIRKQGETQLTRVKVPGIQRAPDDPRPEAIMRFDRPSINLNRYKRWLTKVKGLSEIEADDFVENLRKQESSEIASKLSSDKISEAYAEDTAKLAEQRGVKLGFQEQVLHEDKPIAGITDLNTREATISRTKGGLDTPPHEIFHNTLNDYLTKGNEAEKKLASNAILSISKSPEFKGKKYSDVEEFLVGKTGEDFVRRVFSTDGEGDFKNYIRDFWAHVKDKTGKANEGDYARMFSRKLAYEPSYDVMFKEAEDFTKGSAGLKRQEKKGDAPVTYRGAMENPKTGFKLHLYDLTEDIKNAAGEIIHPKGSTVSDVNLKTLGYSIPKEMPQNTNVGDDVKRQDESEIRRNVGKIFAKYDFEKQTEANKNFDTIVKEMETHIGTKIHKEAKDQIYQSDPEDTRKYLKLFMDEDKANEFADRLIAFNNMMYKADEAGRTYAILNRPEMLVKNQEESTLKKSTDSSAPSVKQQPIRAHFFNSDVQKVRALNTPEAKTFADSYENFAEKRTENIGKYTTPFLREAWDTVKFKNLNELWHNDNPELQRVLKTYYDIADGKPAAKLGANEKRIQAAWEKVSKEVYEETNKRPGLHQHKEEFKPGYFPQIPKKEVIRALTQEPAKRPALKKQYMRYLKDRHGMDADKSGKLFDEFIAGFDKETITNAEYFGPLDQSKGLGIPPEWRNENFLEAANYYLDRVGRRLAYYDAFEATKTTESIKAIKSNEHAKAILREINGVSLNHEPIANAIMGTIKSGMLGPLTGVRDVTANMFLGWQHMEPDQTIRSAVSAWKNIRQGWEDSFKTGRNRHNFNALEWGETTDIVDGLKRLRDMVGTYGGRNWLEKVARAFSIGQGRFLAVDYYNQFESGRLSKMGHKFFNDFAKGIEWKKGLKEEDILKISARFVDSVQGTYDARGTSSGVREGSWAPYLSLSRWSIEKLNNFEKHVVKPAQEGNYQPLLMSTIGMVVGGAAVNTITEAITGRKQKTAEIAELQAGAELGDNVVPDIVYKLAGIASASGYAGMLSDLVRAGMDVTYGKNKPQLPNNVLLDGANNLASLVISGIDAAGKEGMSVELMGDILSKAMEDNLQVYRIALAQLSDAKKEDIERANKMRDLRVYNTIAGNPISDLTSDFKMPMQGEAKEFKKEKDIQAAAEMVPSLVAKAIEDSKGSPERLRAELSKLKRNSYQTMPNPNTMPESFLRYITYLEKSQGPEEAQKRLTDYIEQNAINQAKSSMIP